MRVCLYTFVCGHPHAARAINAEVSSVMGYPRRSAITNLRDQLSASTTPRFTTGALAIIGSRRLKRSLTAIRSPPGPSSSSV